MGSMSIIFGVFLLLALSNVGVSEAKSIEFGDEPFLRRFVEVGRVPQLTRLVKKSNDAAELVIKAS